VAVTGSGLTMIVDGVECPMYFNEINQKESDDMSEVKEVQEVKVGDVWLDSDGDELNVVKVVDGRAASWYMDDGLHLRSIVFTVDHFSTFKLIERDGKEIREFEYGFYPCQLAGTLVRVIRLYSPLHNKMRAEDGGYDSLDTYDWIGEKIELGDLK